MNCSSSKPDGFMTIKWWCRINARIKNVNYRPKLGSNINFVKKKIL